MRKTERGSVILSVGSFPRRGDDLFDPRDDIISQLSSSFANEIKARSEQKQQHEEQRVRVLFVSERTTEAFSSKVERGKNAMVMTRSITPLKKRTNNPPPKIHCFFRGEKQRATRSKARRVTHHKEDKTRNTRTCLVITLQCANAEALWAIMDCILFLFVCVFEVNSRAEMC